MPTIPYINKAGQRIPGVTTVLNNIGWGKNPLMWWAWNEGREGRDFRDTSKKACDAGTICHAMIEAELKERDVEAIAAAFEAEADVMNKAEAGYLSYLDWAENQQLTVIKTEIHLVSEQHQFGGTPDVIARYGVNRKLIMLDLKTSNNIYETMLSQLAAYEQLWLENGGDNLDGGLHLLRVGKDQASFHHHFWQSLLEGWETFLHALELHRLQKELKRII